MTHLPLLSVVVCTHNRPDDLRRCLDAIARLDDPVDLIVIDSASDPPIRPIVDQFTNRDPSPRTVREHTPGLSRARNRGLALAATQLVAYLDDDCTPQPDWARRITAPFANPQVAVVGGACLPAFDAPAPAWLSAKLLAFAGITNIGTHPHACQGRHEYPFGGNACYRTHLLRQVGGFPETTGRTGQKALLSAEETPVIEALVDAGHTAWLEPAATMHHRVTAERCTSRYYWRRLWWQGRSRARQHRSLRQALLMLAALPIRIACLAATRDRLYLYRLAESAGYLYEASRP